MYTDINVKPRSRALQFLPDKEEEEEEEEGKYDL